MTGLSAIMYLYLLALGMFAVSVAADQIIIHVDSSQTLEEQLQNISNGAMKNVVLELDSSQDYKLSQGTFTSFVNITITIKSNNEYRPVNVFCSDQFRPSRGLCFVNSTVSIVQVNFISCGSRLNLLSKTIVDNFNSSSSQLHYSHNQSAVLLMVNCIVHVNKVMIKSSYGFAVIGHNLIRSNFSFLNISCSNVRKAKIHFKTILEIGSGMLLQFTDTQTNYSRRVFVQNSTIENNIDQSKVNRNKLQFHGIDKADHLYNAAGFTILYTQTGYKAYVNIEGVSFINNTGRNAGGMLVIVLGNSSSSTHIKKSFFNKNFLEYLYGADLQLLFYYVRKSSIFNPITIENTSFRGGSGKPNIRHTQMLRAIYIKIYHSRIHYNFNFTKLRFTNHSIPEFDGTCINIQNDPKESIVNALMTDITAVHNTNKYKITKSLFYFENVQNVSFTGVSEFKHNQGSVIHGRDSNVYFYGRLLFKDNAAENGAAIRLEGNGQLNFMKELNASFIDNRAYSSGGAIYINSYLHGLCGIQIKDHTRVHVNFHINVANTAGNTLFVQPIYKCENNGNYRVSWVERYMDYFSLSKQQNMNNSLLSLSTFPERLEIVYLKNNSDIVYNRFELQKFPGEKSFLEIRAKDLQGRSVFSFISTEVLCNSHHCRKNRLWLQKTGGNTALEGCDDNRMNLSIHTTSTKMITATLVLSVPRIYSKTFSIKLLPCPLGFSLDRLTGSCKCSKVFKKVSNVECLIDEQLITTQTSNRDVWIGIIEHKPAISEVCPVSFCNTDPHYKMVKSTDNGFMLTNDTYHTIPYCLGNREGVLCGKCINNYSIVFWSSECKQCSNLWLLTIIGYLMLGPFLVYILFALKLTLTTGTINGVVFYAQVATSGLLIPQSHENYTTSNNYHVSHLFLSFLNLNFNRAFPLCFYDGMNQLWKTGLSLVFPVYLLSIVVVIIIISRYSTWLSNRTSHSSIQVLVTVVHLSFSKLLITLIDVFTPATVYTTNGTQHVWYWDGSVPYWGRSHNILGTITIITVTIFIVPYIVLLIVGKPLTKCSKMANFYLRPIYEAIHAPYKEGKQYWFTARLILLIIMYLLYMFLKANHNSILNTAIFVILSSFTVIQAISRPFKNIALNILDCWIMLNITIVYNTLSKKITLELLIFVMCMILLVVLTIVLILGYHIYLVRRYNQILKKVFFKLENTKLYRWIKIRLAAKEENLREMRRDSYYESCTQCREPLITEIEYDST